VPLSLEILADGEAVAHRGAAQIADAAREAVEERGRFVWAVSGGRTPWRMLDELAALDLPWERMELFQVDERVAPAGDPERNWTQVRAHLVDRVGLVAHPMAVDELVGDGPEGAFAAVAERYARELAQACGTPPVLDLVHLGLGADGHTASLVPGDPVLRVEDAEVAATRGAYQGRRRITLTFPALMRARRVLWVVTGAEKHEVLGRLLTGDDSIPGGRLSARRSRAGAMDRALADREAATGPHAGGEARPAAHDRG